MKKGEVYTANLKEKLWQDDQAEWRPFSGMTIEGQPALIKKANNPCPSCGQEGYDGYCLNCGWPN